MEPRIFATEVIEIKPCQNDRRATETVFFNWLTELNEMFSGLIFPKSFEENLPVKLFSVRQQGLDIFHLFIICKSCVTTADVFLLLYWNIKCKVTSIWLIVPDFLVYTNIVLFSLTFCEQDMDNWSLTKSILPGVEGLESGMSVFTFLWVSSRARILLFCSLSSPVILIKLTL